MVQVGYNLCPHSIFCAKVIDSCSPPNERAFDPLQRHALRPSSKAISLSIIIGAVIVALALGKSISGPLERLIESIGT